MYDPFLENFAIFLRVLELILSFSMVYFIYIYVRYIVLPSKTLTRFNVILVILMVLSIFISGITSIAVNEAITNRKGLDVLPNNPTLNAASAVITSVSYYEFTVGLIYILYLRSYSIVQLQKKYQQYLLKIAVFAAMAFFQASMILYLMSRFAGYDFESTSITGNTGSAFYVIIDVYYLYQFIKIVRRSRAKKGQVEKKLEILAQYGILQTVVYFVTLVIGLISTVSLTLSVWITISPWLNCVIFTKMSFALKAVPEVDNSAKEGPSSNATSANLQTSLPSMTFE